MMSYPADIQEKLNTLSAQEDPTQCSFTGSVAEL
jgi:hypothetical protein